MVEMVRNPETVEPVSQCTLFCVARGVVWFAYVVTCICNVRNVSHYDLLSSLDSDCHHHARYKVHLYRPKLAAANPYRVPETLFLDLENAVVGMT